MHYVPLSVGVAGLFFAILVALASLLALRRTEPVARRLFLATLAYLPLLLGAMVADRLPVATGVAVAMLSGGR